MLVSTGNNFGAGTIKIQAYQAENYVVLNTMFSIDTSSEDYQAAEVLEIYVPTMRIDRSAVTPVFLAMHDRRGSSGSSYYYDSGTILRSWIKDQNTICIEKKPAFDQYGTLDVYIATLYPQLNQGIVTPKSTQVTMTPSVDAPYLSCPSESFMVVTDHWVFIKGQFACSQEPYAKGSWVFGLQGLPNDVSMQLPIFGGSCQYHYDMNTLLHMNIVNGRIYSCARMPQGGNPTVFAFLVRGDNEGYPVETFPEAHGDDRMWVEVDQEVSYDHERYLRAKLEFGQSPVVLSVEGTGSSSGPENSNGFTLSPNPKRLPSGECIIVGRSKKQGSLAIFSVGANVSAQYTNISVNMSSGAPLHEELDLFDTGYVKSSN